MSVRDEHWSIKQLSFSYRLAGALALIPRCRITSSKETSAIFSTTSQRVRGGERFNLKYGHRVGPEGKMAAKNLPSTILFPKSNFNHVL